MVEVQNQVERNQLVRSRIVVEPTTDRDAIYRVCCHPRIFPHISDDYIADPKDWTPPESPSIRYLLASDDQGAFGFGAFLARTWTCWESHIGFLPRSYGGDARKSFERMIRWMWENTTATRLVGEIVRSNTLAIRFARRAGFEVYGINRKSYLRGGILHDQVCLGISKP